MRILSFILLIFSFSLILVSCQKEVDFQFENGNSGNGNNNSNNSIVGDYTFLGVKSEGTSSVEAVQPGITLKSFSSFAYESFDNRGTIKITSSKITFSQVGYEIDTVMNTKTYMDGSLLIDMDVPLTMSYPVSSPDVSADYKKNSTDSITLSGDTFFADPNTGVTGNQPIGAKIVWSSDTLRLYMTTRINTPITQNGVTGTLTGNMKSVLVLEKK